ncbi:transposase [Streptomyces atratus]|uniref:transposase n=1 Tax=Streptomyces atratus TaxID=1893 RepID=UPI0036A9528F
MGSNYSKRYSDEYKRDAIELVRSSGRTVTDVARELGISSESLRGWVKKARAAEAAPVAERDADGRDEELKRLRKLTAFPGQSAVRGRHRAVHRRNGHPADGGWRPD